MPSLHHSQTLGYSNVLPLEHPEWEDLRTPITRVRLRGTKEPIWRDFKGTQILGFRDRALEADEEIAYFTIQLPHSYKEGTNLRPHIHWAGEDNTAGNIVWKIDYSWANVGDVFPSESAVIAVDANAAVQDSHNIASFTEITGTGKEISSMLLCAISRNSSNALDTFTSKEGYALEIDFHFQINTFGSQQELAK